MRALLDQEPQLDAVFAASDREGDRELWRTSARGIGAGRVAEINPTGDADPSWFVARRESVLFSADDGDHGHELWRTDGTAAGTWMVRDIARGPAPSAPEHPVTICGVTYFTADDGAHGRELWRSDGTRRGTWMLRDLVPGPDRSSWGPWLAGALGCSPTFTLDDGIHGRELWITDGSRAGTRIVEDIRPGPAGSAPIPLGVIDDRLLVFARDGVHGPELWSTDGTPEETALVLDIAPGSVGSMPRFYGGTFVDAAVIGSSVAFAANDDVHGNELWLSDGTAGGTHLVADIDPRADDPITYESPHEITVAGDLIFFAGFDGFSADGGHGFQLWASDGTPGGTSMVEEIQPGGVYLHGSVALGERVVFAAGEIQGFRWWGSDGTAEGTTRLAGWGPEPDETGLGFGTVDDVLVVLGAGLWRTDGRVAGTRWIRPVGTWKLVVGNPYALEGVVGDRLFFAAADGRGKEPWVTDGTGRGTYRVADIA